MKNKKNILIVISIFLVFIGTLLPAITIAQENISFIKENGIIIIILVAAMFLLVKLDYKQLLYIPSILSIIIILKFMIDNKERLRQITEQYNCYASYRYGIAVMLLGNIIILILITIDLLNINKIKPIFEKISKIIDNLYKKIKSTKNKLIETMQKNIKENKFITKIKMKKTITHETTKDGKIKFNKITVKCDKPTKVKTPLKRKIETILLKVKKFHPFRKKLSISKYKEKKTITYNIPVIDIKKWTRSNICCTNCGATINTTSEYCFLCDCKIKLNDRKRIS